MIGYVLLDPDGVSWTVSRTPRRWKPPKQDLPPVIIMRLHSYAHRWHVYRSRAAALRDLAEIRSENGRNRVRMHEAVLEVGRVEEGEA